MGSAAREDLTRTSKHLRRNNRRGTQDRRHASRVETSPYRPEMAAQLRPPRQCRSLDQSRRLLRRLLYSLGASSVRRDHQPLPPAPSRQPADHQTGTCRRAGPFVFDSVSRCPLHNQRHGPSRRRRHMRVRSFPSGRHRHAQKSYLLRRDPVPVQIDTRPNDGRDFCDSFADVGPQDPRRRFGWLDAVPLRRRGVPTG